MEPLLSGNFTTVSTDRYQSLIDAEKELLYLKAQETEQENKRETTIKDILREREQTHGSFKDQAEISDMLKFAATGSKNWNYLGYVKREALCMILHKISRILSGDSSYKDHWDDIAGYATLISKELK